MNTTNVKDLLSNISERLQSSATVTTVYGEPIVADGRTIIPVARVRYGFGGGGGSRTPEPVGDEGEKPQDTGGGGGGGVDVTPVGFIEITPDGTRYVSIEDRKRIMRLVLVGLVLGFLLLRRRRRG